MTLFIANTAFEFEIGSLKNHRLHDLLSSHSRCLQLQFLPLLYSHSSDGLLVTNFPPDDYLYQLEKKGFSLCRLHLISDPLPSCYSKIVSWGYSKAVADFAKKHNLLYEMPSWKTICTLGSKLFSFQNSSKLSHSALIHNKQEVDEWAKQTSGRKLLKTCFGFAGRGHLFLDDLNVYAKAEKQWAAGLPLIGEPWVARILDFSTQWHIYKDKSVEYLGATLCETNQRGQHIANIAGDETLLFSKHIKHFYEHKNTALSLLEKMKFQGYFGPVGIDAFLYLKENLTLHHISEINPRETMGLVALKLFQLFRCSSTLRISFGRGLENRFSLLPSQLGKMTFDTQLLCDIDEKKA